MRRFFGAQTRAEIEEWIGRAEDEWAERAHGRLTILDRESGAFPMIAPDSDASTAVARRLGMTRLREDVLLGVPVVVHAVRREG